MPFELEVSLFLSVCVYIQKQNTPSIINLKNLTAQKKTCLLYLYLAIPLVYAEEKARQELFERERGREREELKELKKFII